MMIADGIDPSELMEAAVNVKVRKQREPRPAKYAYIDDAGERKTGLVRVVHHLQLKLNWMPVKLLMIS